MSQTSHAKQLPDIGSQMAEVNQEIVDALASDVALINQLSAHIIQSGGKRLRPRLTLLAANAAGFSGKAHYKLATIIEFIHTATLLHDDVIDASELRRGAETANALFGNQAAVLTGDFLYSRAFQLMNDIGSMSVMRIMADTTNLIAEGEVLQLMKVQDIDLSEADYFDIIYRKTAKLFETACLLGGVIAGQSEAICVALGTYGNHLGKAFQMVDDVMDYQSDRATMGKNTGDDLAEGKMTLPLIAAYARAERADKVVIKNALGSDGADAFDAVVAIMHKTKSIKYTIDAVKKELDLAVDALAPLPASAYKDEMRLIAEQSLTRLS